MAFNRDIHHRQSIRLREYDYSQAGSYFITICTHERQPLFGSIVNGVMALNAAGAEVETMWQALPRHYPSVALGEYVVMPNHFHGIVEIVGAPLAAPKINAAPQINATPQINTEPQINSDFNHGATNQGAASSAPTLGQILRRFKSTSAIAVNRCLNRQSQPVWQRNYYEHIIRTEQAYQNIAEYIRSNPQRWHEDSYYI